MISSCVLLYSLDGRRINFGGVGSGLFTSLPEDRLLWLLLLARDGRTDSARGDRGGMEFSNPPSDELLEGSSANPGRLGIGNFNDMVETPWKEQENAVRWAFWGAVSGGSRKVAMQAKGQSSASN